MNRYSLKAYDPKSKNSILLGIDKMQNGMFAIGEGKSPLHMIDIYTTMFENEKDVIFDLLDLGIIDRDVKLSIEYQNNGPKQTAILYSADEAILPFTEEHKTNVSMCTVHFNELLKKLLNASGNIRYMEFMFKYGYINEHLYTKLKEYNNLRFTSYRNLDMLTAKISKDLSAYKTIRDIYIGTRRYKKGDEVILPTPSESIEDTLLDEEEKNQFDKFLFGGEEELYNTYDREEISDKVLKRINEYHKKGI